MKIQSILQILLKNRRLTILHRLIMITDNRTKAPPG